jgi:hypothetical protein
MFKWNQFAAVALVVFSNLNVVHAADTTYPQMLSNVKSVSFISSTRAGDYKVTLTFPDQLKGWEYDFFDQRSSLRVRESKQAELVKITYEREGKITQQGNASRIDYADTRREGTFLGFGGEEVKWPGVNFTIVDSKLGIEYHVVNYYEGSDILVYERSSDRGESFKEGMKPTITPRSH